MPLRWIAFFARNPLTNFTVQFLGSGDAFGSGGRFQTCIYVDAGETRFLFDCGASSLVAMKRFGVDPCGIDTILVSHFHGDHFAGIPFLIRETQIASERTEPLLICGPAGVQDRVKSAMEILFPGSSKMPLRFPIEFIELHDSPQRFNSLLVTSYPAVHTEGTEARSLRVECGGKIISYSGDTEWNENLIEAARSADLFVCESFSYDKEIKNHMSYRTLMRHREKLTCKRLILTHMNEDLIGRLEQVELQYAEDGKTLAL
jgi:ribonuclease BN (tRNA processing enzyme)